MTPERQFFNDVMIPKFREKVEKGKLIYDIGKSLDWHYSTMFQNHNYKTIDISQSVNPDILMDVENAPRYTEQKAEGIILMGVTEQCFDPFMLIDGADRLLGNYGYILLGMMSIAYPIINDIDYVRFTPNGAKRLLNKHFDIEDWHVVEREKVPSYVFAICRKVNYD